MFCTHYCTTALRRACTCTTVLYSLLYYCTTPGLFLQYWSVLGTVLLHYAEPAPQYSRGCPTNSFVTHWLINWCFVEIYFLWNLHGQTELAWTNGISKDVRNLHGRTEFACQQHWDWTMSLVAAFRWEYICKWRFQVVYNKDHSFSSKCGAQV